MKYSLVIDNEVKGYIDYTEKNSNKIFINLILIYEKFRGNNYSSILFEKFRSDFQNYQLSLVAKEDMNRYGKLYNIYKSWGFKGTGKESIYSENQHTFRKKLFVLNDGI